MEEHLEEVLHGDLLDQVESILSEDAMVHVVAVVCMRDALHPKLDWSLDSHEEGEEEATVWEHVAESVHEEEK